MAAGCLLALALFGKFSLGVRGRGMRLVAAPFAVKIALAVASRGWRLTRTVLRDEALHRGPGGNLGAVDGKVLVRKQGTNLFVVELRGLGGEADSCRARLALSLSETERCSFGRKRKREVVSDQGKEAVVAILGPGHFFGEGCLNGHPLRIATARTVDECVVTRLEKATMIATVHQEPKFSEVFMSYLLTRNSRIEEDLIDQLFNSSEKRLAQLLLLLANFGKEGKPELIVGKFSQETLAEMIGTTRSRVSNFMNKFRDLGFISYSGSNIEVHSALLSVLLNDKPQSRRDEAIDAE